MTSSSSQVAFDTTGTLGRVWLAAHWDKRLTKNSISSHDIPESIAIIKSPGNVYSLRISGFLLLGLIKIYSKKSIIALEEAEQALASLTQTPTLTNPEVLREIGLTEVPEKLKLAPVKKPELFNPIIKPTKPVAERAKVVEKISTFIVEAPVNEDNDVLGVTTSFLDDVEMAEQWLKKDDEAEVVELPSKRPRERVWQNFINTNFTEAEVVMPDPPEPEPIVKREEIEPVEEVKLKKPEEPKPKQKSRSKHAKNIVKDVQFDLIIDPETNIGLDCTSDIVKNTRLYQPVTDILPTDIEQIFYICLLKDIAPELENFYVSHVKMQRLKNVFREEEKEPVILSNTAAPCEDKVVYDTEPVQIINPPTAVVEPPKVEKTEEKTEETWSSRTLKLLKLLKIRLSSQKTLFFDELSKKADRRIMACGLYEILQLCLKDFVIIEHKDDRILLKPTERLMRLSIM